MVTGSWAATAEADGPPAGGVLGFAAELAEGLADGLHAATRPMTANAMNDRLPRRCLILLDITLSPL
jgi:hypothetical protein